MLSKGFPQIFAEKRIRRSAYLFLTTTQRKSASSAGNHNKQLMRKHLLIALISLAACKHQPEEIVTSLQLTSSQTILYEGDSMQLTLTQNNQQIQAENWSISYGSISPSGLYISETIQTDTLQVIINATYKGQQATTKLSLVKRAFLSPPVSFTQTVLPIFVSNCNFTGCHGNGSRASKVELSCYDSVVQSIVPYNAMGSRVYFSLVKTDPLRIMPPAGKLHQQKIDAIKNWIDQGAKEN